MHMHIRSSVFAGIAFVGIGAVAVAPLVPLEQPPTPRMVVSDVELTASPPLGAIPLGILRNQAEYCSVICPHIVELVRTVPVATLKTPATFLGSLTSTRSPLRAIGATAASVTGPANTAVTGIITNDVYRVVPKAFNNLEVAVVELFNIGGAVLQPGEFVQTVTTAREHILAALNQPLPPPVPTETGATTLPQVLAVETIRVSAAVAFQAGEILLLGVVQTADAAAQELAASGDPAAALTAGATQARASVATATGIVTDAVDTAVTNIRNTLGDTSASGPGMPNTTAVDPPTVKTRSLDQKKPDQRDIRKRSESLSDTKDSDTVRGEQAADGDLDVKSADKPEAKPRPKLRPKITRSDDLGRGVLHRQRNTESQEKHDEQ